MNKILKNRFVIAAIAILLALLCSGIFYAVVSSSADTTEVIKIKTNVSKGAEITSDMIETTKVGGYNLSDNVVTKESDVIGKYALADFSPGDLILADKITDNSLVQEDSLDTLNGSKVAISITIQDFADGLSDKLMGGDIVSCIVTTSDKKTTIPAELTYVEVVSVTDENGIDKESSQTTADSDNMATVTLLATPKQAALLSNYEQTAEIQLALVYRGDSNTANQFIAKQDEVLNHA